VYSNLSQWKISRSPGCTTRKDGEGDRDVRISGTATCGFSVNTEEMRTQCAYRVDVSIKGLLWARIGTSSILSLPLNMFIGERAFDLAALLKRRKSGVRRKELESLWTCSSATVHRVVKSAREGLGLPIRFDVSKHTYYLDPDQAVEMPGLWFGPEELSGLLSLSYWLDTQGSGILREMLDPLRDRLQSLLEQRGIRLAAWKERIRFLPMGSRLVPQDVLLPASRAVLERKRLAFAYRGVHDPAFAMREVSPQTLVRYRDNWFLDAYCHTRKGLRSFALSRMKGLRIEPGPAWDIPRPELDAHFSDAYGIFNGKARHKAALVFEGLAARFAETEQWHPRQRMRALEGGKVRLEFPCGDVRELVRDLMRYADEVEVEGPAELRTAFSEMVRRAASRRNP
jgi:proteasome accessory factor C